MWREAGGGIGMGNTCKSMADSCQCMAKTTTIKNQLKKKKCVTNKDLLYSTGNSAQGHVAAWMGGEFRGEWRHVCVQLTLFAVHQKLSQHC